MRCLISFVYDIKGPKKIKLKTKDADVANEETKKKPEKAKKSKGSKKDEVPVLSLEPELTEKEKAEKKQKNGMLLSELPAPVPSNQTQSSISATSSRRDSCPGTRLQKRRR